MLCDSLVKGGCEEIDINNFLRENCDSIVPRQGMRYMYNIN